MTNIRFFNFASEKTYCGRDQRLFRLNPYASDIVPRMQLTNSYFENVNQDALAYLFNPPNEWAVLDDCGSFPCTGPKNVLIRFVNSKFSGEVRPSRESDF